jgi:hypothetical protein
MKFISKQDTPGMVEQTTIEFEQQVRCRAYELYEDRGRTDGHAMDDWLRAEPEITGGKRERAAA